MESAALASTLELVDAALWAGVVYPERLPSIATWLLAEGADTSTLRVLAGLDLAPFDPREARDLFLDLLAETSVERLAVKVRVERVAHLLAVAHQNRKLSTAAMFSRFHQLALAADYPDHYEVMYLYGLEDEWRGAWGRTRPEVEAGACQMTGRLVLRRPLPPIGVVNAVGDSE